MRRPVPYALLAVGLVVAYVTTVSLLWANRDWHEGGPLAKVAPETTWGGPLGSEAAARRRCHLHGAEDLVRGTVVDGRPYYGCYDLDDDGTTFMAWVVDEHGRHVWEAGLLKRTGAWRWVGLVKTVGDLFYGALGIVAALLFGVVYYRRARPGKPSTSRWWQRSVVLWTLALVPIVGWVGLGYLRGVSPARKVRAVFQVAVGITVGWYALAPFDNGIDGLTVVVLGFVWAAVALGVVGGRVLLAPPGFGAPDDGIVVERSRPRRRLRLPRLRRRVRSARVTPTPPPASDRGSEPFSLERPTSLPSFRDVGGMDELKDELRETIGLTLAFAGEADDYKLTWNGILLHGRPGVGKTFIARATAGEFGLNFVHVSAGDLVSAYRGESSRNVEEIFAFAARNVPCLLFFDEFDSIAQNREDWPDQEVRRTVNQLLQTIVEYRVVREQIVMAATNHLDSLDPAVIRPGRFDRMVRVDLPDGEGRAGVFRACLRERPTAKQLDVDALARRTAGFTPAAIAQVVERAAMAALRRTAGNGSLQPIAQQDLLDAIGGGGGEDRPSVEGWTWDDLVLPPDVIAELQQLELVVEDPDLATSLGVEPPTGLLLTGPPGTGKTSIAKVLAAQADCSFYPVSAGDLTSMWLGESEKSIQRLFERARENRPSIIFIDEIDALASRRGEWGSYDRQINELLSQMDGMDGHAGVLVVAATNRPDQLDPAILRGGRLSRTIEIPLPGLDARRRLLQLFSKAMPLHRVDLDEVATATEGAAGADLRALCQQAAMQALVRVRSGRDRGRTVTQLDFDEALADWREGKQAHGG